MTKGEELELNLGIYEEVMGTKFHVENSKYISEKYYYTWALNSGRISEDVYKGWERAYINNFKGSNKYWLSLSNKEIAEFAVENQRVQMWIVSKLNNIKGKYLVA